MFSLSLCLNSGSLNILLNLGLYIFPIIVQEKCISGNDKHQIRDFYIVSQKMSCQ